MDVMKALKHPLWLLMKNFCLLKKGVDVCSCVLLFLIDMWFVICKGVMIHFLIILICGFESSLDLVVSCLGLHWTNDLPGAMIQVSAFLSSLNQVLIFTLSFAVCDCCLVLTGMR